MTTGVKFGMASVVALVVIAVLIGSHLILGIHYMNASSSGVKCSSNLHQIGLAIMLYEDENHGQFPRTLSDNSDDPKR